MIDILISTTNGNIYAKGIDCGIELQNNVYLFCITQSLIQPEGIQEFLTRLEDELSKDITDNLDTLSIGCESPNGRYATVTLARR